MRHQNSVFHQLSKQIPWAEFDKLVSENNSDKHIRHLSTKSQFLALLFGQLSGSKSLREIEAGLKSHENQLYHLGAKTVARSTLSEANAKRSWRVFRDLFAHLTDRASRQISRKTGAQVKDVTRILDSTRIRLSDLSADWSRSSRDHCDIKVHLVFDPNNTAPVRADITPGKTSDIAAAKAQPITPNATYVFDLAYYDFQWWADLDAGGCRFVSRLKNNTKLNNITQNPASTAENILSDITGYLPKRLARSRKNPMSKPLREIKIRITTGKIIRIVTNDLKAPAREIAELYKQRWQIELFFKWIKQNLKIKHFLGTSENAVRIQIYVALIAFMLIRMAHQMQNNVRQILIFARLIKLNIMHKRPLGELAKQHKPPPFNPRQLKLQLAV